MRRSTYVVLGLLLCLLAWGLRLAVVGAHRLHPDEALYGYWGLLVLSGRDPWLANVPVYKPPLLPYLLSGSLALLGQSEWAVRLPGLVAGLATVGLTGRLARRLYRSRLAGLTASLVTTLSPFTLLFSATGFTDPLMVALGIGACVAAIERHPVWAGALAGLSFAAKQTGIAWWPLVGFLLVSATIREQRGTPLRPILVRCAAALLAVVGVVLAWDQARVIQGAQGFWQVGVTGYGGLRLIWPQELGPRLRSWLDWLHYLPGAELRGLLLVGAATGLTIRGTRRRDWSGLFDIVLIAFCLAHLLIHWLWAFPVWDRYILPLAPLTGVLLGRAIALGSSFSRREWVTGLCVAALAVCLALPAGKAVAGQVPIGAGLGSYDGIEQASEFLGELPGGTVLYHHWLGWEYRFYLFDAPLYLAYWPTPAWLARDAAAFSETEPRYIVFPAWESSSRVEAALEEVDHRLEPVLEAQGADHRVSFTVYHIEKMETAD